MRQNGARTNRRTGTLGDMGGGGGLVLYLKGGTAVQPRAAVIVGICHLPSGKAYALQPLCKCDLCLNDSNVLENSQYFESHASNVKKAKAEKQKNA